MPSTRVLNEQFDLNIPAPDRLGGVWKCCGDIIDRERRKPVGRVYGRGSTGAVAEEEVTHEVARWLLKGMDGR